jgi:hypothetical protein
MPSASNFNSNQRLMNLSGSRLNFGGGLSPNYIEEIEQHPAGKSVEVYFKVSQVFLLPIPSC